MRPIALLLAAVTALSLPLATISEAAEVVSGVAPGNGKPPSVTPGGSWNGTSTIIQPGDSDGYPYVRQIAPNMQVIQHKTNVTIASAAVDTSLVPFTTAAYRQLFVLLRVKAASFAAAGAINIAVKANTSATADSTSLGWFFKMGGGISGGRVTYLTTLTDRWQMIPLADSLSGLPYQAPYTALAVTNRTGAQVILDVWLLGVPW